MLKHLVAEHQVEAILRVGQRLARRQIELGLGYIPGRNLQVLPLDVDAGNLLRKRQQRLHVHADAAAIHQHPAQARAGDHPLRCANTVRRPQTFLPAAHAPLKDHVEAAILPCAPDKAGVAAEGGALAVQFEVFHANPYLTVFLSFVPTWMATVLIIYSL